MRWRGRRQSGNVQDIRSTSGFPGRLDFPGGLPGGRDTFRIPIGTRRQAGGGLGCGTLIVIFVVLWALGINPLTILSGLGGALGPGLPPEANPQFDRERGAPNATDDEKKQFVATILGSTEEVWAGIFRSYGKSYADPQLVLFTGGVRSACGLASTATGPFYCPGDKKVYIDLAFYDQLRNQFGAKGDFAEAYVLAHEVGHHVQNLIGILPQFNRMRQSMGKMEVNRMSV